MQFGRKRTVHRKRRQERQAGNATHLTSTPTRQKACTVASNWLPMRTNASLTSSSYAERCAQRVSTSWSCFVRLSKRDTARCTSVSERDWAFRFDVDGEDRRGDTGEEDVEETVHVESAEAGRRAVW